MVDDTAHRVALVTGASSGIGRATAAALAEAGWLVALVARDSKRLAEVSEGLVPGSTRVFAQDLTDFDRLAALVAEVEASLGPLTLLVNNAGVGHTGALATLPLAEWQQVLAVNLTAPFALTQAVLPGMRARRCGTIINIVSIAGQRTFPEWGAYATSKHGLMAFSRTLAQEVRSEGIRVVALCPGAVDTPLWDSAQVQADFDRSAMLTADSVARLVLWAVELPEGVVLEEAVLMPNRGAF